MCFIVPLCTYIKNVITTCIINWERYKNEKVLVFTQFYCTPASNIYSNKTTDPTSMKVVSNFLSRVLFVQNISESYASIYLQYIANV